MSKHYRREVVELAKSWLGKKESDGSYKEIIDIYNSQKEFPRGTKMDYSWAWCACTWSAIAIKLGYTDIMPVEISCNELINKAKGMGIWVENDAYVPSPADAILYDWQDDGKGDNTGWPDHVGVVEKVENGEIHVIEGNASDMVKRRVIKINAQYIRGFITPKYDAYEEPKPAITPVPSPSAKPSIDEIAQKVIDGKYGNGEERKKKVEADGYNYSEVQARVNAILKGESKNTQTATVKPIVTNKPDAGKYQVVNAPSGLYLRKGAGTNYGALTIIPDGTIVSCDGQSLNSASGVKWLYIEAVVKGVKYIGYSSSKYLKKL